LAQKAFNGKIENDDVMDLGGMVSRKLEFIPAINRVVQEGWVLTPE